MFFIIIIRADKGNAGQNRFKNKIKKLAGDNDCTEINQEKTKVVLKRAQV